MLFIEILSLLGFLVSSIVHACTLLRFFDPPKLLSTSLTLGAGLVVYLAVFFSRKAREKADVRDFRVIIMKTCPHWLLVSTGIVILYVFVGLVFRLTERSFGSSPMNDTPHFNGYWLALFAIAYLIVSCSRRYLQTDQH